jgi:hypothetical protein
MGIFPGLPYDLFRPNTPNTPNTPVAPAVPPSKVEPPLLIPTDTNSLVAFRVNRGRLTDRTRGVLSKASRLAAMGGYLRFGSGHILLAMAHDGAGQNGGGVGSHVLKEFGVTVSGIESYLTPLFGGPAQRISPTLVAESDVVQRILMKAALGAQALGHNYVGTEHILTSLISGVSPFVSRLMSFYCLSAHLVEKRALELVAPERLVSAVSAQTAALFLTCSDAAVSGLTAFLAASEPAMRSVAEVKKHLDVLRQVVVEATTEPPSRFAGMPSDGKTVCCETLPQAVAQFAALTPPHGAAWYPGGLVNLNTATDFGDKLATELVTLAALATEEGWPLNYVEPGPPAGTRSDPPAGDVIVMESSP